MSFEIRENKLIRYQDDPGVTAVLVPDGITEICGWAFGGSAAEEITLPADVCEIGKNTFSNCKNLKSMTLPEGVTAIPEETFKNCENLFSIRILAPEISIHKSAFLGCLKLADVDMPESARKKLKPASRDELITGLAVDLYCSDQPQSENMRKLIADTMSRKKIQDMYFNRCVSRGDSASYAAFLRKMKKPLSPDELDALLKKAGENKDILGLPKDNSEIVKVISEYRDTVYSSDALKDYKEHKAELENGAKERTPAEWKKIFKISLDENKEFRISGYKGLDENVVIPDHIGETPVSSIKNNAFEHCKTIASITIPASVKSIGEKAFRLSSVKSVTILNPDIDVGELAFSWCSDLGEFKFPNGLNTVITGAFHNTNRGKPLTVKLPGPDAAFADHFLVSHIIVIDGEQP